ncbi:hypothetical protein PF005_g8894 [Phytophthora fragariae]|uniref:Uncharacterized protein n=1 Tax=Phytophthora fragariae TaxID=53985 RepID=A0A6A4E043_9STRA|nr:hypothetical protein PF003_g2996 [Phytophthora fragariae]KAE8940062.1 hypothetical protein PF009_g10116 [Phytophthora fragariae]KAE9002622.1 hypothetical protein PF011_g13240 [Phytophthora fragariae]KAE9118792.1 hypothetical protein PF010_g8092 [Phytophthora fragariae]KAE9129867.1 hypothetical protein PF007_g4734 [Phytophthora fragariae]
MKVVLEPRCYPPLQRSVGEIASRADVKEVVKQHLVQFSFDFNNNVQITAFFFFQASRHAKCLRNFPSSCCRNETLDIPSDPSPFQGHHKQSMDQGDDSEPTDQQGGKQHTGQEGDGEHTGQKDDKQHTG